MTDSLNKASSGPEGDVTNCVSNLVHAFTNGLDIFKKLRERRRKKKSKREKGTREQGNAAELQLSNSLRKGPQDIQKSYENCYGKAGDSFAKGDSIAHASLAETLIKLNTGLVGIIAAFLSNDSKGHRHRLDLDYKSLTNLSNASRIEAVESLEKLYQRCQSQVQVYRIGGCAKCGSMKHQSCSGRTSPRSRPGGATVTRIPVKASTQTQLAVVRPRNTRKGSSSSSSSAKSAKSNSTAQSSPLASPPTSPLPLYTPKDPFPPQGKPMKANPTTGRRRAGSFDGPRPTTWPTVRPDVAMPLPKIPSPRRSPPRSPPAREKHNHSPSSGPVRRRMDKVTPSTYTFASDSTKLGEIPQRNWAVPWNAMEAERLNAEAVVSGYQNVPAVESKTRKKGLFGFLRRGSAAAT